MSIIGSGGISGFNLASSVAGAQRNSAAEGEMKQTAADRKAQIDRNEAATHVHEDVGETETTPDRDVDGRMPYGYDEEEFAETPDEPSGDSETSQHAADCRCGDAFGERGASLDLEA